MQCSHNFIVRGLCSVLISEWEESGTQDWASLLEWQSQDWASFHEEREAQFAFLPSCYL